MDHQLLLELKVAVIVFALATIALTIHGSREFDRGVQEGRRQVLSVITDIEHAAASKL